MPLQIADQSVQPVDLKDDYLIFYASIEPETGKMWCPDCRDVESLVHTVFEAEDGPSATIAYVGLRPEWRQPSNPYRDQPWNVTSVPCIIRRSDSARLNDFEFADKLDAFVKSA